MLILMRQVGEEIYIDKGRIKIEILQQNEDNIAIGIKAPAHIDVHRKEVFMRKLLKQSKRNRLLQEHAASMAKES